MIEGKVIHAEYGYVSVIGDMEELRKIPHGTKVLIGVQRCMHCGQPLMGKDEDLCSSCEERACPGCGNIVPEEYGQYCPRCS